MSIVLKGFWIGLFLAFAAQAGSISLSLNTTPLIGGATAPYFVEFQLVDGDGLANSTVTVSGFGFGAGSPLGLVSAGGGVSGDLSGAVTLTDSTFFSFFYQMFTPGDQLTFDISFDASGSPVVPDRFTFAILNSSFFEVPTTGAGNELLGIDLKAPGTVEVYAGVPGVDPQLGAPVITNGEVPELGTSTLVIVGVAALIYIRKRSLVVRWSRGNTQNQ